MTDRTAHDTVRDVAFERFVEWDDSHTLADAVLAALGIDPDTPVDDVKAGLIALSIAAEGPSICVYSNGSLPGRNDAYVAGTSCDRDAFGPTPAAAVLALAARLEEQ